MKGHITVKELALIERVHPATVTRWIGRNLFPNARLGGGERCVPVAEHELWREATKAKTRGGGRRGYGPCCVHLHRWNRQDHHG